MGLDHFLCFLRREVRISHLFLLIMLSFCCNAPPKQAMLAKITKFELVQYLIIRWIHENLIIKETFSVERDHTKELKGKELLSP